MTVPGASEAATANVILNANVSGYNQGMAQAAHQTGLLSRALNDVERHLNGITARVGHGLLNLSGHEFAYLGVATTLAATFEKQLATLSARAVVTGESFSGVKGAIETSFNKFPVSRASVVELTESLTTLGVKGPAALNTLTQTFIKLGAATGENSAGLAAGLVQLSRLMGTTNANQITNYANALLTVSAKAGVSATSVLNFSQAIAPLARQAGIGTTAVLGISTAFSKAGADGFVAANAFNSIISQITSLSATGSPELAKFSNVIGKTTGEFKKMDKTEALTQFFEAIDKGGAKSIDTLNRLGFDGVRALSAIQAVASSGDLRKSVSDALGSSGDHKNLDKGAKAAFGGMADAGIQLKNTLTQNGTMIGTTFLLPLTAVLKVTNLLVHGFAALAPFRAVIGALAGAFGLLAGSMLIVAAISAKIALGGFIARSGPVGALRAGLSRREGPLTERQAAMVDRPWNRPFYLLGQRGRSEINRGRDYLGARRDVAEEATRARETAIVAGGGRLPMGRTVEESAAVRAAQREAAGPLAPRIRALPARGLQSLITTQREFVTTAGMKAEDRPPGMMPRIAYQGQRFNAYLRGNEPPRAPVDEATRGYPAGAGRLSRMVATVSPQNQAYNASIAKSVKANEALAAATARVTAAEAALAKETTEVALEEKRLAVAAAAAARTTADDAVVDQAAKRKEAEASSAAAFAAKGLAAQMRGLIAGFARLEVATAGAAMKTAGAGIATAAGGVARTLKGIGLLGGLMIGVPLLMGAFHSISGKAKEAADRIGATLNPITKYNDQLGISTSNLASFTAATADATAQLNGVTAGTSMRTARHVSDSDVNLAQSGKVTDKAIKAAFKPGMSASEQQLTIASLLPAYDLRKPQQVQLVKNQLIAAGFKRGAIQNALLGDTPKSLVGGTKALNFGTIPGQVAATEGHGVFSTNTSASGSALADLNATQIGLAFNANQTKFGASYAGQKRLLDEAAYAATSLKAKPHLTDKGSSINADQLAGEMATMLGGSKDTYRGAIDKIGRSVSLRGGGRGGRAGPAPDFGNISTEELEQLIIKQVIPSTRQGKNDLTNLSSIKGTTLNVKNMPTVLARMLAAGPGESPDQLTLHGAGPLGVLAAGNKAILASKADSGDPAKQTAGIKSMLGEAQMLGSSFASVDTHLDQFMKGIGDTTNQFYILAAGAKTLNEANRQAALASMNRAPQFGQVAAAYVSAAQGEAAGAGSADNTAAKKAAYDQDVLAQQQFQVSSYQSLLAYHVQVERANAAYTLQRGNAERDFRISETHARDDQHRQVARSEQDFATQMRRQAETNAQSIYDPFARVQAKYTLDAGTTLQILQEQNGRIAQQSADLVRLKKMGVSQHAIDTLDLANSSNSQQTSNLVGSLMQDPKLVSQINGAVATRLKSTTALTQSNFSMSYRNTSADFKLQISRGAQDFETSTKRAIAAQTIALSDMDKAFRVSATNSAQDLATAMKQSLGNFGSQLAEATSKMGPLLAQLPKGLQAQYREAWRTIAADAASTARAIAALSSTVNGSGAGSATTAEHAMGMATSSGINPAGQYGFYGPGGTFHREDPGVILSPSIIAMMPHIKPPGGHAEGGISTFEHTARFSEGNKPEAIIPLDARGLSFMTAFANQVSMAMVRQMQTSQHPSMPSGPQSASTITYTVDQGNTFSGPVHVEASDPDAMAKALAAKARLAKLTSPSRH